MTGGGSIDLPPASLASSPEGICQRVFRGRRGPRGITQAVKLLQVGAGERAGASYFLMGYPPIAEFRVDELGARYVTPARNAPRARRANHGESDAPVGRAGVVRAPAVPRRHARPRFRLRRPSSRLSDLPGRRRPPALR